MTCAPTRSFRLRTNIPRLIISAVVFLVAYLFFSLVIRDPLPMLDEIIISFALFLMVKAFNKLKENAKKKEEEAKAAAPAAPAAPPADIQLLTEIRDLLRKQN